VARSTTAERQQLAVEMLVQLAKRLAIARLGGDDKLSRVAAGKQRSAGHEGFFRDRGVVGCRSSPIKRWPDRYLARQTSFFREYCRSRFPWRVHLPRSGEADTRTVKSREFFRHAFERPKRTSKPDKLKQRAFANAPTRTAVNMPTGAAGWERPRFGSATGDPNGHSCPLTRLRRALAIRGNRGCRTPC